MSREIEDPPEPHVDSAPERAPGGADALPNAESDVGAESNGEPLSTDPPLSAQQDEAGIPDELQEPQPPEPEEQATDNTTEPSA